MANQRALYLINVLAKQLSGALQDLAYVIKAQIASSLIESGQARLIGVRTNGAILCLEIADDSRQRFHVRRSHLSRQARAIIDRQRPAVPVLEPLGWRLKEPSLNSSARK